MEVQKLKLGILVVYFVSAGNEWVLKLHLKNLARTIPSMDFKVYAAVNRLSAENRKVLSGFEFIELVNLPTIADRSSAEHGTYLDMLARHAAADGCDYVCTFDVDSWPIVPDWIDIIYRRIRNSDCVGAAVLRTENGDTVLPHPLFSFLPARLFESDECRYWISQGTLTKEYLAFLSEHAQHGDTGAGIGFFLQKSGFQWLKILRTNRRNLHWLMAGIYGDVIFHVGASSREDLVFRGDDVRWLINLVEPIRHIPYLWKYKPHILRLLKKFYEPSVIKRNREAYDLISDKLKRDECNFYHELLAGE